MPNQHQTSIEQSPAEVKFRTLFEKANDAIFLMTEDVFIDCNPKTEEIFGCTREEILNRHPYDFSPEYQPDGRSSKEKSIKLIRAALAGKPQRFEWKHSRLDGTTFDAEVSLNRVEIGSKVMLQAIVRDISERKKIEKIMEDLARYPEENPNPVLRVAADGKLLFANTASKILLRHWNIEQGDPVPAEIRDRINAVLLDGQTVDFDINLIERVYSLLLAPQPDNQYVNVYGKDITDMRRTQQALTESEERYRAFIENSNEGIWRFEFTEPITIDADPEAILQHSLAHAYLAECNDAMAAMYGFTDKKDLLGIPLGKLLPEDNPEHKKYLLDFVRNDFHLMNRRTKEQDIHGNEHVFENNLTGIIEDGQLVRVWGTQQDVTEKETAAEALRASEEKFRALTESTSSSIFIYQDGVFKYVNSTLSELTGYDKSELVDHSIMKVVHPDFHAVTRERSRARLAGEDVLNRYEFKVLTKSGTEKWVDFTATLINFDGNPAALGTAFDITERKRAELVQSAIFRISEVTHTVDTLDEVYSSIHEIIQELMPAKNFYIALYDAEFDMIHFPYFVDEMTDTIESRPRQSGKGITEYVLQQGEPLLAKNEDLQRLVREGEIEQYGQYSVDWLGVPLQTNQSIIGVMAVQSYDEGVRYTEREKMILSFISRQIAMTIARKRTESELARERQQLAVTLRSIGDGVITTDTEGRIRLMNRMAERLTGWTEDQAIGKQLGEVFPLVNRTTKEPIEFSLRDVMEQRKTLSLPPQTILKTRGGDELLIADSIAPLSDEESTVVGAVLVFRDETEKFEMEQELLKSRKLESVGTLAGGIAHDFNNILAGILGNISLAKLSAGNEEKMLELLSNAERAAQRASTLTNQLLTFSKGGAPVKESISIKEIIKESVEFALHGSNVRYELKLPDDLWTVEVDPGQIDQVINNIVINADQAMSSGGTIRVNGENYTIDSPFQSTPLRPGEYVRIAVTDTGTGIPAEDLEKIFDPYFSTKEMGHGLGLATCYSIIQKHGGKIEAESEVDRGTTITIYLPANPEMKNIPTEEYAAPLQKGDGRVLVMDDDDTVLEIATEMLGQLGYQIATAKDGDEAVRMYQEAFKQDATYDAVVMDLTIPGGKGGKEAAKEILDIDSDAQLIVSSGYSTDQVMSDFQEYGFVWKIAKPYSLEELSQAMHRVLQ